MIATLHALLDEISRDTSIGVAVPPGLIPGGFSFNPYLIAGARPLLPQFVAAALGIAPSRADVAPR